MRLLIQIGIYSAKQNLLELETPFYICLIYNISNRHACMLNVPQFLDVMLIYKSTFFLHFFTLQEGDFPVEACFPAAFRCVRVRSLDNEIDQYAYQTSVSIGGNVFTGILYDQGPELAGNGNYVTGERSTSPGIGLLQQENFVPNTTVNATGTSSTPYSLPFYAFTTTTAEFFDQFPKSCGNGG